MVTAPTLAQRALEISLKGRALRFLAAREHSRSELQRKLAAHAQTPEQLVQVLDELQAKDFISQARVVASVVNRRQAKLGASRIKRELLDKGVDKQAVAQAVLALQMSELERARELWQKKFAAKSNDQPPDRTAQAKQMRFLAARGFSSDVIRRVIAWHGDDE